MKYLLAFNIDSNPNSYLMGTKNTISLNRFIFTQRRGSVFHMIATTDFHIFQLLLLYSKYSSNYNYESFNSTDSRGRNLFSNHHVVHENKQSVFQRTIDIV